MVDLFNSPIYFAPDDGSGEGGGGAPDGGAPPDGGTPPPDGTGSGTVPPAGDADPFDNAETQQFPREYVEKLRKEAGDRRTAVKPFEEAFDGYDQEEVDVLLGLVRTLSSDPKTAAAQMAAIVENINEAYKEEADANGDQAPPPVTAKDVEKMLADRDQQAKLDAVTAEIESTAKELGYEQGTEDYIQLLWLANNKTDFDLREAHKLIEGKRQAVIDKYLEDKQAEADGSLRRGPDGSPAGDAKPVTDFTGARAQLEARLKAEPGQ